MNRPEFYGRDTRDLLHDIRTAVDKVLFDVEQLATPGKIVGGTRRGRRQIARRLRNTVLDVVLRNLWLVEEQLDEARRECQCHASRDVVHAPQEKGAA